MLDDIELAHLYVQQRMTLRAIAALDGRHYVTIQRKLRAARVPMRKPGTVTHQRILTRHKRWYVWHTQGMSKAAIARRAGVARKTVQNAIHRVIEILAQKSKEQDRVRRTDQPTQATSLAYRTSE